MRNVKLGMIVFFFLIILNSVIATTSVQDKEYRTESDTLNKEISFGTYNHTISLEEHRKAKGTYATNELEVIFKTDNFPFYPNIFKAQFPEGSVKEYQINYEYEFIKEDFQQVWVFDDKTDTSYLEGWKSVNTTQLAEIKNTEDSFSYKAYRNISKNMQRTTVTVPITFPIMKNKGDITKLILKAWLTEENKIVKYNITVDIGDINKVLLLDKNIVIIDPFFNTTSQSDFSLGANNRTAYNATEAAQGINASDYLQELPDNQRNESEWFYGVDGDVIVTLYHFNNFSSKNESNSIVYDFSESGINGTLFNGSVVNGTAKLGDFSGYFNNSGYVNSTNIAPISANGEYYSVVMWVYPFVSAGTQDLFSSAGYTSATPIRMVIEKSSTDALRCLARDDSSNLVDTTGDGTLVENSWNLIACVRNDNTLLTYINGEQVDSVTGTLGTISAQFQMVGLHFNRGLNSYQNPYFGLIDELAVFNKSLSAEEIKTIYNRQREQYIQQGEYKSEIFDAGKVANWTNMSWTQTAIGELKNNRVNESQDERFVGGIDMSGNVLLFHFNNESDAGENATHVKDWSTNGAKNGNGDWNNGTWSGGISNASGMFGSFSGYFDGSTDYVKLFSSDHALGSFGAGSWTISAWINKKTEGGTAESFITMDADANVIKFEVAGETTDKADIFVRDGAGDFVRPTSTTSIEAGRWYHLVATRTGTTVAIYVNGIQEESETNAALGDVSTTDHWYIGIGITGADDPSQSYNGFVDEIAFWNRTLSDDEIQSLYKRGITRLNLSVRSCGNSDCSDEDFVSINNATPDQNILPVTENRYFQYRYLFTTNDTAFTPFLYNTSVGYQKNAPLISFVEPTPTSGATSTNTTLQINISITENNLAKFLWDWNGTNHTFYNDTLMVMYNFEGIPAVGDSPTQVADLANEFHATCSNNCPSMNQTGAYYQGFTFDGDNDFLEATAPVLNTTGYSVEFRALSQISPYLNLSGNLCPFDMGTMQVCFNRDGYVEVTETGAYTAWNGTGNLGTSTATFAMTVWNNSLYTATGRSSPSASPTVYKFTGVGNWLAVGNISTATTASAITVWNNTLYAGEDGSGASGRVFRYDGDETWTSVGAANSGKSNGVLTLAVWNGSLYAGMYNTNGSVMRYDGGTTWTYVGLGFSGLTTITALGEWNGSLYAGETGGRVYKYLGDKDWLNLGNPDLEGSGSDVTAFGVYNGSFYVGITPSIANASVFVYNASNLNSNNNFTHVAQLGTASTDSQVRSLTVWNGTLYASTGGGVGRIYRYDNNGTFSNIWTPSSGTIIRATAVWNGTLFAATTVSSPGYVFQYGNGTSFTSTNKVLQDKFYHVVVTRNTTNLALYLDGIQNATLSVQPEMVAGRSPLQLGRAWGGSWQGSNGNYFNGTLDEFRLWNRSLTGEEIAQFAVSNLHKDGIGNWTFYSNQTLTGGIYTYRGCAEDSAGQQNCTEQRTFEVIAGAVPDTSPPNVSIITPLNYSNFSISDVVFNVSVNDSSQNISVIFQFSNGSGNYFNRTTQNLSGFYNLTIDTTILEEGLQNMTVFANDSANNQNYTERVFFTIDKTFPNVTWENPANSSNFSIRSNEINFSISVKDLNFINLVLFSFDNASGNGFNLTGQNLSGYWNVTYNVSELEEGRHRVTAFANDSSGNLNHTEYIEFTVDFTAPTVTWQAPVNDSNFSLSSNEINFSISINEANSISTVVFSFDNATGNGFNLTAQNLSGFWNVTYNVSALVEGFHEVTIFANDSVGNMNQTQKIYFTTDFTHPSVSWVSPSNNAAFGIASNEQIFNVSVTEANFINLVLFSFDNASGIGFNLTGQNLSGYWNATYNVSELEEGRHRVTAFVNDSSGNLNNTQYIEFIVDFTAPNVTNLTGVQQLNQNDVIEIKANVTDNFYISNVTANVTLPNATQIRVALGNSTAEPSKFNASFSITDLTGTYDITFFANDTANLLNNSVTTNFTVIATVSSSTGGGGGGGGGISNYTIAINKTTSFFAENEIVNFNVLFYQDKSLIDPQKITVFIMDAFDFTNKFNSTLAKLEKGKYLFESSLKTGTYNVSIETEKPFGDTQTTIEVTKYSRFGNFTQKVSENLTRKNVGIIGLIILSILIVGIIINQIIKK